MDWNDLAQGRDRWRALVNSVMNLTYSIKCGEFLDYLRAF
jgi:phenylalanine-4-hydroxylase